MLETAVASITALPLSVFAAVGVIMAGLITVGIIIPSVVVVMVATIYFTSKPNRGEFFEQMKGNKKNAHANEDDEPLIVNYDSDEF